MHSDRSNQEPKTEQRPIGAVFAVGLALLFALLARQGWSRRDALLPPAGPSVAVRSGNLVDTLTPTATLTVSPTATPTMTAEPTPTAGPTATPSPKPTQVPPPTAVPTATPWPLPTPDGVERVLDVPVLMYHYVSAPPDGADAVRRDLSVPPEMFRQHLHYLKERGYTSISLHDFTLALQTGYPLPERPVVITFDDGYRDHYTQAFPLLQEYGYTGTFFLITSLIDQEHSEYLSWDQVMEMDAAGMEMQAHGYTHEDMRGQTRDYLIWQMLGSKEAIEARTHKPVRFFCYPLGHYDDQAIQVLRELDYWGATTTAFGSEHRPDTLYSLDRLRIHGNYDAEDLSALLPEQNPASEDAP